MSETDLVDLLNASPFKPFRVHVSDGAFFDIPHGDFARVAKRKLIVTLQNPHGQSVHVSLLHITRIEVAP